MHLSAKGSASAMKTFQSHGELHGLWVEVCLLCRGPGRRSGGKGCWRKGEWERHHGHVPPKREDKGQWAGRAEASFFREKSDPRKWW